MILKMLALSLAPVCLLAQTAPPAATKAEQLQQAQAIIRERAKRFYDLLVAGKARASEEFVCEASKDQYYESPKDHPLSAEVAGVEILPDDKTARVTTLLEDKFFLPMGSRKKVMQERVRSDWKLESGQWCYYLEPAPQKNAAGPAPVPPGGPIVAPKMGQPPPGPTPADLPRLSNGVTPSKPQFKLPGGADGKDEIVVTSGINGPVKLVFGCRKTPGLECKSDKQFIGYGMQAKLTVEFKYSGAKLPADLKAALWVEPFHRLMLLPIVVTH